MTENWIIKTPMPMPFKADGSCAVYDGKLYIFGGYYDSSNDVRKETFVYDPKTDSWMQKADMPTARWGNLAIEVDGLIYVFGGNSDTETPTLVVEVYNPVIDSWTKKADLPSGFTHGLMGVRYKDKIHLFCQNLHYEYDIATDIYTQKLDVPTSRRWGTCAIIDDKIYIIGGAVYKENIFSSNVNEMYDLTTNVWITKTSLPIFIYGPTRENPVIDGKIYIVGGYNSYGPKPSGFYNTLYVYNPSTDSWEKKAPANYARDGVECGIVNNKLYVIGGRNNQRNLQAHINIVGLPYCEEYSEQPTQKSDIKLSVEEDHKIEPICGKYLDTKDCREILQYLKDRGFTILRLQDWGQYKDEKNIKVCLMRHDLDISIDWGLELAKLEHSMGVHSTYFVLHTAEYYRKPDFISKCKEIQDMGHEIGLHVNCLAPCLKNHKLTTKIVFEKEVAYLRANGIKIYGCAAHGAGLPPPPVVSYQIFKEFINPNVPMKWHGIDLYTISLAEYGLYEAYYLNRIMKTNYLTDCQGNGLGTLIEQTKRAEAKGGKIICQMLLHPCNHRIKNKIPYDGENACPHP